MKIRGQYAAGGNDPDLELSPLSGHLTRNGLTVEVHIFRRRDPDYGWLVGIIDREGGSVIMDDAFPTDQEALRAFTRAVDAAGLQSLVAQAATRH